MFTKPNPIQALQLEEVTLAHEDLQARHSASEQEGRQNVGVQGACPDLLSFPKHPGTTLIVHELSELSCVQFPIAYYSTATN